MKAEAHPPKMELVPLRLLGLLLEGRGRGGPQGTEACAGGQQERARAFQLGRQSEQWEWAVSVTLARPPTQLWTSNVLGRHSASEDQRNELLGPLSGLEGGKTKRLTLGGPICEEAQV